MRKMRIKKNDTVVVISGDYKGSKGKVLKAFPKSRKIIVEKVNMMKKHVRPDQKNPEGGIIEKEAPIHVSNCMIYNTTKKMVTKAVFKVSDDGTRNRVCTKTGDELK